MTTYLLYTNSSIALKSNESAKHESLAYDLNDAYPSSVVAEDQIPTDYDIFRPGNLYHLEVLHQKSADSRKARMAK